jgi:hypothetical protein
VLAIALSGVAATVHAQDAPATASFRMARTGVRTDAPQVGTYRYLEFFQARGDWVLPDIGALDFYHDNYREFFIGAGRTLYNSKAVTWVEELYFAQATGSLAQSARYLWPWTMVDVRFASHLTGEVVYFPYVPLNRSAGAAALPARLALMEAVREINVPHKFATTGNTSVL